MRRLISFGVLFSLALLGTVPVGAELRASNGVLRGDLGPAGGQPLSVARNALERHETALGVDAGEFGFDSIRRSIVGVHVRGNTARSLPLS